MLALAAALSAAPSLAQQVVTEGGKSYKLHTVAKGEGFYRLSVENGVTQEDILSANPNLKNTGLVEGVVVRIPIKQSQPAAYTVRKGDTAYSIAKSHGISVARLLELNPSASAGVKEGQVLKISAAAQPQAEAKHLVDYVVEKGETTYSIAQGHGLTVAQFLALNPSVMSGLKAGDVVKVPSDVRDAYVLHVIADGETLYSIGARYGVKVQQIIDANVALNPAQLPVGTAVRIPQSRIPQEDDAFYYHRVARGETLYSLCVKYNVLQDKIMAVNNGVRWDALRVGEVIAVPKEKQHKLEYDTYEVGRRETLFSIAQAEGVSVDDIIAANDGLTAETLQRGMTIRIPRLVEAADARPATADTAYIGDSRSTGQWGQDYDYVASGRPTVNVFLMLPFNAYGEMKELRESGVDTNKQSYAFKSRRYVEFYEGVRMALDSLAEAGANINLKVFDTNNRLQAINQLNVCATKPDLIIGPAHRDEMADVMAYANDMRVPVVLPFAQCDSTILDNPYIFQASVIDSITGKEILTQMARRLVGRHVIMIKSKTRAKADAFRASMLRRLCAEAGISVVEHDYNTSSPAGFLACLREDVPNVVVIPTNNEARVNSVLTSLAGVVAQKPAASVELWATSEWLTFQTIEIDVFHRLNTKIFTTFAVDEADPQTAWQLNKYRRRYFTEPIAFTPYFQRLKPMSGFSEYGLWGYDIAMKFVGARVMMGPGFVRNVNAFRPHALQSNFRFRSLTNWGGAVNVGLKTITFRPGGAVEVANVAQ